MKLALVAAFVAVAVAVPAVPGAAQTQPYETTKGKSQPKYVDRIQEDYRVETKFGHIYGVVIRPVVPDGVKVPVILTYSPYNVQRRVSNAQRFTDSITDYFVPRGYARAMFDLVGTRESGGCYDYGGIRERKTGAAVVDFLGSREWSNGKVGMIGVSYDGTTPWAAAVEAPKHLTTIVPQVGIGRWWNYAWGQGVRFYSGFGTPYLFDFGFGFLPPTDPTDPGPWAAALQDHIRPCERIEHNDRAFLPDPVYDEFWEERDYLRRIHKVRASVMIEGSWRDYNVHPVNSIEMWNALPPDHPKRLVMALQGHGPANLPDSQDIRHAWFDYWLLDLDTGVTDLPRSDSLVAPNVRFQDPTWPPPGTHRVAFTVGHGRSSTDLPLEGGGERAIWTDHNPYLSEQEVLADLDAGAGIVFLGDPAERDVRISGAPILKARVTTSGESTFLTPVLFDEDENGRRAVFTRGLLNSRNRHSLRTSKALEPGDTWTARVVFQPVDWLLRKGHRLGLAVMSMNSNEALYPDEVRSTNEISMGGRSFLLVPMGGRIPR